MIHVQKQCHIWLELRGPPRKIFKLTTVLFQASRWWLKSSGLVHRTCSNTVRNFIVRDVYKGEPGGKSTFCEMCILYTNRSFENSEHVE